MKINIPLEVSEKDQLYLLENSIERVFNNAILILKHLRAGINHEDGWILLEDLEECKTLISSLFTSARNEVYIARSKTPSEKKGESVIK